MKNIRVFSILLFIGFTASCSPVHSVKYDYDRQTNFSNLKTFGWMQPSESSGVNSLVVQRIKNAVNTELKAKGLTITSDNPDILIAEYHGKKEKLNISDWGYRRVHRYSYTPSGVSVYTFKEGSLILDFVDAQSNKMIWRGSAKAQLDGVNTPEESERLINKAVKIILEKYPPPSSQ